MACAQVAGYGYRRVPADSTERPYGRVIDWRNPSDLGLVISHATPGDALDVEIDTSASEFYGEDRINSIVIDIDWGDGNIDTAVNVNLQTYPHTYLAAGNYDVVITATNAYGICESVTEAVVAIDV